MKYTLRYLLLASVILVLNNKGLYANCFPCGLVENRTSFSAISADTIVIPDKLAVGLGLGYDYGGVGLNLGFFPLKYFGVFGGAGYAFADPAYTAGLKIRGNPMSDIGRSSPFLVAMYGYNTAVRLEGSQGDRVFYGYSVGAGVDIYAASGKSYFSLALLYPFRTDEAEDYFRKNSASTFIFKGALPPLVVSIGFKYILF